MRPVYLLLGLSFIALLSAGCSSSEQPVPSAPTPDLEATVEAMLEEKLATSSDPSIVSIPSIPKIIEVVTEVEVIKEVIVEVPVEKEVVKEVAVEKIVEVEKIVVTTPVPPATKRVIAPTPIPATTATTAMSTPTPSSPSSFEPLTDTVTGATIISDFQKNPDYYCYY